MGVNGHFRLSIAKPAMVLGLPESGHTYIGVFSAPSLSINIPTEGCPFSPKVNVGLRLTWDTLKCPLLCFVFSLCQQMPGLTAGYSVFSPVPMVLVYPNMHGKPA